MMPLAYFVYGGFGELAGLVIDVLVFILIVVVLVWAIKKFTSNP